MFDRKRYKIGFDIWGAVLFIIIMLPNFIWFTIATPHDILRNESVTPLLDSIAAVVQVMMIIAICLLTNCERPKTIGKKPLYEIVVAILLYFIGWTVYYMGIATGVVILDLCIAPCMAFILFSKARANGIAFLLAILFMTCHVIYGVINFIM